MSKKYTVLITGASRGIGKSIAQYYINKGHEVLTPTREDIDLERIDEIEQNLKNFKEGKKIDVLICSAGTNENKNLENYDYLSGQKIINVNLLSNISLIQTCSLDMRDSNFGRIVLIGSLWSKYVRSEKLFYSISKSGLVSLGQSASIELGKFNILVNTISPGFVNTEMTAKNLNEEQINSFKNQIPLGRFAESHEISPLVYFLGSEDNSYITGQNILIDGGWSVG
jgi:3-oxoacyl-[acyl-carrier protein] reductase